MCFCLGVIISAGNLLLILVSKLNVPPKLQQRSQQIIMELFDCLPLAALVNGKFICMHGGISHELQNLKDISKINRFQEIPKIGLFCDLLWADPIDDPKGKTPKIITLNTTRGCSYFYGNQLCQHFMSRNKITSIIRAHQAQLQGYKLYSWQGFQKFPTVITIFSAPNYCDFLLNKGSILHLSSNIFSIEQFHHSAHPYILPNFIDLFQWSVPFVSKRITQILYHFIGSGLEQDQIVEETHMKLVMKKNIIQRLLEDQGQQILYNMKMINKQGFTPDKRIMDDPKYHNYHQMNFQTRRLIDVKNQQFPEFEQL